MTDGRAGAPYEHLRLEREQPVTDRHPGTRPHTKKPEDSRAYARNLRKSFDEVRRLGATPIATGFDNCSLIKIRLNEGGGAAPDFEAIPGVEVVSQEEKSILLAFATAAGMDEFERRLTALAKDGTVRRADLFFAIQAFEQWTADDRMGPALSVQGLPSRPTFVLDAELWPQERAERRASLVAAFRDVVVKLGGSVLDTIEQPSLVMVRIRCGEAVARALLAHRDVRTLDLPPRLGLTVDLVQTDVQDIAAPPAPDAGAPIVGILDSGVTTNHPLLAPAVGDAQGFLSPDRRPGDEAPSWHGTFVSGVALYGDVEKCIRDGRFIPELRLVSGRVFRDDDTEPAEFVEKAIEEAVREFQSQYSCSLFNLSYGDRNKVYDGRHLRSLAYTLDRLTRDLGVLFVVPTGNLLLSELPAEAVERYPDYLLESGARLLDPATALNALTVGGLALYEATQTAQRHPDLIEARPIARTNQPFPLTRSGPSVNGAIKPDLVEFAGNVAVTRVGSWTETHGLGLLSLNGGFAAGRAFKEDLGTSFAAPAVAHQLGRLVAVIPKASPNLLRSIVGAHCRWPVEASRLLNPDDSPLGRDKARRLLGYGKLDARALTRSLDDTVTLVAEESLTVDQHHFFEIPLPDGFWDGSRRLREVSVSLSYTPDVRTTRLEYRMSKLWFVLATAADLADITGAFRKNREEGRGERGTGRWLSNEARKKGTLQVSRWQFRQRLANDQRVFVVVTRQDATWSTRKDVSEPYALTIVVSDRENTVLYSQIRSVLEVRNQVRARARV